MKTIFFRFSIALSAFVLGLSVFGGYYWIQIKSESPKLETAQTIINKETIVIPTTQESSETENSEVNKPSFEEGGYYYIIGEKPIGGKPTEFYDFEYFELDLWDYDEKNAELIPTVPHGSVYAKYPYNFKKVFIGKEHLEFETETIKGISYQFKGKLVEKTYSIIIEKDVEDFVYLEGVLTKLEKGKILEQRALRFGWTLGC